MKNTMMTMAVALMAVPAAAVVPAPVVAINQPGVSVTSIDTLVMGAKYRVSPTNFDVSLDAGGGTQLVAGSPNFVSANLGNLAALNNVSFDFALRNIAGQGIVFSVGRQGGPSRSLAWGSFSPALQPTPSASTVLLPASAATGQTPGTALSAGQLRMNALHLEVSSRRRPLTAPNTYDPVVSLSNLAFTASGATLRGSLITAQTVTPATSLANPNFAEVGPGFASQWLLTTGDFWDFDWTLSGRVNAQVNNITGNIGQIDEWVKFGVSGKEVQLAGMVPEPQSWAMLIAGLGLVGAAMRRRRAVPA